MEHMTHRSSPSIYIYPSMAENSKPCYSPHRLPMIIPDSEKSESGARSSSARSHIPFEPGDDPPSPPPYSPTILSDDQHRDGNRSPHPTFHPTSSTRLNLPPRCNHLIDRKTLSSLSGTWHIDTALEIPEGLLPPITEFDGRWNREAQQARKHRAEELRRRPGLGRSSGSTRDQRYPFVEMRPNLMLDATNGAISGDVHVVSSDGLVRQAIIVAEGCNGSINLKVHAPPDQLLRVFASSTNGSIKIKIPSSFEGAVIMSTSLRSVSMSDAIKAKLTTFSAKSNESHSFIGDWHAQGFGSALNPTNPDDDPPLPGPQDPFAGWTGPLIDISSTNGAVSLSFIEENDTSPCAGHFTKAIHGFVDGIGRAIALRLSADGLAVALNDLPSKLGELNELVVEIASHGGQALAVPADVSKEPEVIEMVQTVTDAFGGLDVMVANAGIRVPGVPLLEMREEDFDKVMSVNCKGTLYCYRAAARQMIKQGAERGGRIIGASSTFGLTAHPERTPYCTSKFAIRAITQTAALEWGQYGITASHGLLSFIHVELNFYFIAASTGPAFIQKIIQQVPLKRMGQPEEVAALVSFIASPGAAYITDGAYPTYSAQDKHYPLTEDRFCRNSDLYEIGYILTE
ncbi:unnamed protein product [Rhizoctonia solani]|uniref:DUF7330 domain-containing protein n=1 Tax=Rhizoctonia solani TaxID=456999 RepID=A0A8H3E411_9AGAM|nr:unnamed protein product [Rhizoctonia solani]